MDFAQRAWYLGNMPCVAIWSPRAARAVTKPKEVNSDFCFPLIISSLAILRRCRDRPVQRHHLKPVAALSRSRWSPRLHFREDAISFLTFACAPAKRMAATWRTATSSLFHQHPLATGILRIQG